MTDLILVRHGETDWNTEGRWQGQVDVPLNATGFRQAYQMARALESAGIAAITSSDLQRARQTAQILADSTGLPLHLDHRLREVHQGEWQGLLFSEIQGRYDQMYRDQRRDPLNFAFPGGEQVSQVQKRMLAATNEIIQLHPEATVAIVSHGFVLAVLIARLRGEPFDRVWDLIPGNGQWIVIEGVRQDSIIE